MSAGARVSEAGGVSEAVSVGEGGSVFISVAASVAVLSGKGVTVSEGAGGMVKTGKGEAMGAPLTVVGRAMSQYALSASETQSKLIVNGSERDRCGGIYPLGERDEESWFAWG